MEEIFFLKIYKKFRIGREQIKGKKKKTLTKSSFSCIWNRLLCLQLPLLKQALQLYKRDVQKSNDNQVQRLTQYLNQAKVRNKNISYGEITSFLDKFLPDQFGGISSNTLCVNL